MDWLAGFLTQSAGAFEMVVRDDNNPGRRKTLLSPLLRSVAEKRKVNVWLAVADRGDMVYRESVRCKRKLSLRKVVVMEDHPG